MSPGISGKENDRRSAGASGHVSGRRSSGSGVLCDRRHRDATKSLVDQSGSGFTPGWPFAEKSTRRFIIPATTSQTISPLSPASLAGRKRVAHRPTAHDGPHTTEHENHPRMTRERQHRAPLLATGAPFVEGEPPDFRRNAVNGPGSW